MIYYRPPQHQIDMALFAFSPPFSKDVVLADGVTETCPRVTDRVTEKIFKPVVFLEKNDGAESSFLGIV